MMHAQGRKKVGDREEGPVVICGLPLDVNKFTTDKKVTDENIVKALSSNLDDYLPNYKKSIKVEKKKKKDAKAKRAAKKAAKQKRKEEEAKKS